ncbi:MAG TPA: NUDIX domain-containing protein [Verrucomicrobiae bacterium]|jgi:8-oxo-dGTP diphosphatase|nr:NUDIX domain-containing protein [Verrucomicrobiae bacterium]
MPYTYQFPRGALTVDCVVFGYDEGELKVLLIQRALEPFKARWALPGGFVRADETIDEAARRELAEEAGLRGVFLEQLYTFGAIHRDPRERVVSVAYYALVKLSDHRAKAATDAANAEWFLISKMPKLAFDHADIVATALARLKAKVRYQPIGFELLPPKFTLSELQHLYESVLETGLDKRNFRKKVLGFGLLMPLRETRMSGRHRPAQLFRFEADKYEKLKERGFNFEL